MVCFHRLVQLPGLIASWRLVFDPETQRKQRSIQIQRHLFQLKLVPAETVYFKTILLNCDKFCPCLNGITRLALWRNHFPFPITRLATMFFIGSCCTRNGLFLANKDPNMDRIHCLIMLDPPNIWQWPMFCSLGTCRAVRTMFSTPGSVFHLKRGRAQTARKPSKSCGERTGLPHGWNCWSCGWTCNDDSISLVAFGLQNLRFCCNLPFLYFAVFLHVWTGNVWSSLPESTSIEQLWLHFDLHFTSFVSMWLYRVYPTWVNSGNSAQYFPYLVSWSTGQRGCGARAMLGWICFPVTRGGHQM